MLAYSELAQCRYAGAGWGPLANLPPLAIERDAGRLHAGSEEDATGDFESLTAALQVRAGLLTAVTEKDVAGHFE